MIAGQISHYRVISMLGAGGMGEVYLAEDTKLRRRVALKVLPADLTQNEDRLRRFEQEAQAASALNHPNILMIFEIGQIGSTHYIATEFVEGETLRQRLAKSTMSVSEVLEASVQIAGALVAAHSAGIIHRDLKPENVMVRPDGYIKVLDFGLAKLAERTSPTADTEAPTIAKVNTDPGTVMGTVTYMSPEQARGVAVDARSDIFSLGVVIYEMLARRPPFEGETSSDIIASILKSDPAPLARYSAEVSPELQWVVSKALRKDRDERYQTAREMLGDLKNLRREADVQASIERSVSPESRSGPAAVVSTAQGGAGTPSQPSVSTSDSRVRTTSSAEVIISEIKRHKRGALLVLAGLLVVVAGVVFGLYKLIGQQQPAPLTPLQAMNFSRLTTSGKATRAAISPDGKYVVHVLHDAGQQSLWLRQVATESNVQIVPPGAQPYLQVTFSPDGNFVYFARRAGVGLHAALYRVPVLGGAPTKINSDITTPLALSPDGRRVAFYREKLGSNECALMVSNVDGAGEERLAAATLPEHILRAAWSPDGKIIAYLVTRALQRDIFALRIEDKTTRLVISQEGWTFSAGMAWLADGSGLVIAAADRAASLSTQLWQVSYPGGEARRITNDPNSYRDISITADSGKLVTLQTSETSTIWVMPAGDSNRAQQSTSGVGQSDGRLGISWTGDGRIAYSSDTDQEIWIADSNGKNQRQLTPDGKMSIYPSVTPDGRYMVYTSYRSGRSELWRMNLEGGDSKQLTNDGGRMPVCLPDGKWVVYESRGSDILELWKVPLEGGQPVLLTTRPRLSTWALSPDGKLLAKLVFSEEEDVPPKLEVVALEGGQTSKALNIPPTLSQSMIGWTPDGRAVAYIDTRGGVANLWAQPLDGGSAKRLTDFNSDLIYWFAWSPDAKQLALSRGKRISDVVLISNFK